LKADIVQAHGITQADVVWAAKKSGRGTIWQLIDTRAPRPLRAAFRPLLRRLPDVVFAVGSKTLAEHVDPKKLASPAIMYAPPPRRDLRLLEPAERKKFRGLLGVGPDDVLVVSVGNFNPQKGHQHLIDAIARVNASAGPRVKLRIQGSLSPNHPGYYDGLQQQAKYAGLDDFAIDAWDSSIEVPQLLGSADIFVLASEPRSEGLPTVILEAMSLGLPVVASDVGWVVDAVSEAVTGYLVPSQDPAILADRLRMLADDPQRRAAFGGAARRKFDREFTLEACLAANLEALARATPSRT
jgi:glycosyltransferase involved in cell wall biosynthesis